MATSSGHRTIQPILRLALLQLYIPIEFPFGPSQLFLVVAILRMPLVRTENADLKKWLRLRNGSDETSKDSLYVLDEVVNFQLRQGSALALNQGWGVVSVHML